MTNLLISAVQFVFCTFFFAGLIGILFFAYESKRPTESENRRQFIIKLSFAIDSGKRKTAAAWSKPRARAAKSPGFESPPIRAAKAFTVG
jgi:hypothetical protein